MPTVPIVSRAALAPESGPIAAWRRRRPRPQSLHGHAAQIRPGQILHGAPQDTQDDALAPGEARGELERQAGVRRA